MMLRFITNCWKQGKITEADLQTFVEKGFLTKEEAEEVKKA